MFGRGHAVTDFGGDGGKQYMHTDIPPAEQKPSHRSDPPARADAAETHSSRLSPLRCAWVDETMASHSAPAGGGFGVGALLGGLFGGCATDDGKADDTAPAPSA